MSLLRATLLSLLLHACAPEREHKIHNIILYPDRSSWCKTTPIQQVVASPGHQPITIDNNVCVGACYSYSIPITQPAEPGELIGPYCDSCQPSHTNCYHVTLRADSGPETFQKRVQIIMNCSCASCDRVPREDCAIDTLELPSDLFSRNEETNKVEEVPELLHFKPFKPPQSPGFANTTEQRFDLNSKLINLLKSIQEEGDDSNINYDKDQLEDLLSIIEGAEHELSDKNLMEFVNFVNIHNSEDLELDLSRLKEVLTNFERKQKYPKKFETKLHHHLGEEVQVGLDVGHLVKGPHGSMVMAPVEEKLNIDSDLEPNNDGVVISYENTHKKSN